MARFYYFKRDGSNKWKYEGEGLMPDFLMKPRALLRQDFVDINGGWPGISCRDVDPGYHIAVMPDDKDDHGYPVLMMSDVDE